MRAYHPTTLETFALVLSITVQLREWVRCRGERGSDGSKVAHCGHSAEYYRGNTPFPRVVTALVFVRSLARSCACLRCSLSSSSSSSSPTGCAQKRVATVAGDCNYDVIRNDDDNNREGIATRVVDARITRAGVRIRRASRRECHSVRDDETRKLASAHVSSARAPLPAFSFLRFRAAAAFCSRLVASHFLSLLFLSSLLSLSSQRTLPVRRSNSYPRRDDCTLCFASSRAYTTVRAHEQCFVNYTSFLSDSAATARPAVTMKRASRVSPLLPPIHRRFPRVLRRRFFAGAHGFRYVRFVRARQSTNDTVAHIGIARARVRE